MCARFQFAWGSWKLFKLSAWRLQPNFGCASKKLASRDPRWCKLDGRAIWGFESEERYRLSPHSETPRYFLQCRA